MSYVNFVIEDADGDRSNIPIDFVGGFAGDIDGLIETGWAILNPLLNGTLVGASVTLEADISGLVNAAAAAIADVQEKAEFIFTDISNNFRKTITLPTFIETFFTSSGAGKLVDITQSAVLAFISMMEDGWDDGGGTPVEVNPTTNHGEDVATFKKGRQAWGKNRR